MQDTTKFKKGNNVVKMTEELNFVDCDYKKIFLNNLIFVFVVVIFKSLVIIGQLHLLFWNFF